MKRIISLVLALSLCCACAGCSSKEEAPVTEATIAQTQPTETVAETEAVPVLEEPVDATPLYPTVRFGLYQGTENFEVYDCRMYPTENGTTIFAVDYKAVSGLQPVISAYADDGDNEPNYWHEIETLTSEDNTTLVFEMEDAVLEQVYHPIVEFYTGSGSAISWIEIFHTELMFKTPNGNPVGEAQELLTGKQGDVTVYSANMQALDNGYVRFTVDCKPRKDRYISFFNPPEGDRFMYLRFEPTSGERETIQVDVREEDVKNVHEITINFFNGDAQVARIFLSSPVTKFEELDASQFAGFIGGGGQFMLMYYGVIDEAILGATITAEDGTTMEVTEKNLDKNGDGYSCVAFKDFKAKKQDTVSITLSKEGCQDIPLSVYVH